VTENGPRSGYWGRLTPNERIALATVGKRLTVTAGSVLLAQQDTTRDVIIVWSGFTKVVARVAPRQHLVLGLRGPGDLLGEMAHVDGGPRSAAIAAVSKSHLLHRTLVGRLREADQDRIAAASMTVGQRLARLLLRLTRRYGVPGPQGGLSVALLSQNDLAACIGGGRRTVARQIRQWRERGIVSTTRLSVTVHRPEELARIAGLSPPPRSAGTAGLAGRSGPRPGDAVCPEAAG
jgi:CRP/FNR family transcriptional regulator, cyclic AMP receptor protein